MKDEVTLISDTTFKYLFKNEDFRYWLEEIILNRTGIDLNGFELVDNEDNTGNNKIKDYRMDLLLDNKNHLVIIEMQNNYTKSSDIKNYQYLYRKAGNLYSVGEDYKERRTTLIVFDNYVPSNLNDDVKLINYTMTDKFNDLTRKDIDSYEIILPNYHKMSYNDCNKIEKRLWLFSCKSITEMKQVIEAEEDKKVVLELERLNMDPKFIEEYEAELAHKKLLRSVKNEGKQETISEAVINLYENGVEKEIILKSLNISSEEFDKILQDKKGD